MLKDLFKTKYRIKIERKYDFDGDELLIYIIQRYTFPVGWKDYKSTQSASVVRAMMEVILKPKVLPTYSKTYTKGDPYP